MDGSWEEEEFWAMVPRRAGLKVSSDHLKKPQSSTENERFSYENKDEEEPEGENHGMR